VHLGERVGPDQFYVVHRSSLARIDQGASLSSVGGRRTER
jgi:hypothetical protein